MDFLEFADLKIKIVRKKGIRRISLKLFPNREAVLTVAKTSSHQQMVAFLELQKLWLIKKTQEIDNLRLKNKPKLFEDGEVFPFLGKNYELKILVAPQEKFKLEESYFVWEAPADRALFYQKNPSEFLEKIKISYQTVAKNILTRRFSLCAQKMRLTPRELKIKDLNSMWGNCYHRELKITLNWKLIAYSIEVIDYVIIHELSHIIHPNHSDSFWKLVSQYDPKFKEHRKFLRQNTFATDFLSKKSKIW